MNSNVADDLVAALKVHAPYDERERISLERLIEFVESSELDIFDRDVSNHHITGSAFVISPAGLLLHFHKKIPRWLQPGGHVDSGETPLETSMRETEEETGVVANFEPEIFHVDVHDTPSGHVHYDIRYLGRTQSTALNPPPGESQKVAWFSASAMTTLPDLAMFGALQKILVSGLL